MKRFVLFSLLAAFLVCSCAGHKRHNGNVGTESQCRKKPGIGEYLKWFILSTFETERERQRKIPNTDITDPNIPPE